MSAHGEEGALPRLTHVDDAGAARMVDVSHKPDTVREARAGGTIRMAAATLAAIQANAVAKGDVLAVARVAGYMAAKRTAELIPLCHQLPLTHLDPRVAIDAGAGTVTIEAEARTTDRTGVEMEAMTACAVGALTVYDMVKGIEPGVVVERVELLEKTGGKADYRRP